MTKEEAAAVLNGIEYPMRDVPDDLWPRMREAGLVAVFGMSDDLMELRGAVYDELDAYEGGEARLTKAGLVERECDDDDCPHEKRRRDDAFPIYLHWDRGGFSWLAQVDMPHATFDVMEDGETYCRGAVFTLADVPA